MLKITKYTPAAGVCGERWVTNLCETRNSAQKAFGFRNANQLSLFDALNKTTALAVGS
jgi:Holliday junction resolvasome RuvABC DNA-binding subunit